MCPLYDPWSWLGIKLAWESFIKIWAVGYSWFIEQDLRWSVSCLQENVPAVDISCTSGNLCFARFKIRDYCFECIDLAAPNSMLTKVSKRVWWLLNFFSQISYHPLHKPLCMIDLRPKMNSFSSKVQKYMETWRTKMKMVNVPLVVELHIFNQKVNK